MPPASLTICHRELGGIDAALTDLRKASGDWVEAADIDGFRRRGPARDGKSGERAGGERTAPGLGEEVSAALPPTE